MVLDPSLFTYDLVRRTDDESICDWVSGVTLSPGPSMLDHGYSEADMWIQVENQRAPKAIYSRARAVRSVEYCSVMYMTLFGPGRPLATVSAPTALVKSKTLRLYDPDEEVLLHKQGMTLAHDWRFQWPTPRGDEATNIFSWKREVSLGTSRAGKNAYTC